MTAEKKHWPLTESYARSPTDKVWKKIIHSCPIQLTNHLVFMSYSTNESFSEYKLTRTAIYNPICLPRVLISTLGSSATGVKTFLKNKGPPIVLQRIHFLWRSLFFCIEYFNAFSSFNVILNAICKNGAIRTWHPLSLI